MMKLSNDVTRDMLFDVVQEFLFDLEKEQKEAAEKYKNNPGNLFDHDVSLVYQIAGDMLKSRLDTICE